VLSVTQLFLFINSTFYKIASIDTMIRLHVKFTTTTK